MATAATAATIGELFDALKEALENNPSLRTAQIFAVSGTQSLPVKNAEITEKTGAITGAVANRTTQTYLKLS